VLQSYKEKPVAYPFRSSGQNDRKLHSREDAEIWIIQNQVSRRNLDAYTGSVLALKLEPLMREKAKAKLVSMGKIFGKRQ